MSNDCKIIGLTGQIGSGKSTVAKMLKEAGIPVIDADVISRAALSGDTLCNKLVMSLFPTAVKEGLIDRKRLADTVFADKKQLSLLNRAVHPFVIYEAVMKISELKKDKSIKYIVFDAPQLFESGADAFCDQIIAVIADKNTRIRRITARDGLTAAQAELRIAAQYDNNFFIKHCDHIIDNSGDLKSLEQSVSDILKSVKMDLQVK